MNRAHLAEWTIWDLWPWLALAAVPFLALILAVEPLYASVLTLALGAVEFFGYLLYLFPTYDTVLPVGTVLLFTLLTFVAGIVYKYVTEEWEKQKLREAFESYVSESVVEQVTDRPDALELGGEKKRLTVLFSDVRGFTTYSEHLDPQEVVTFLNRFFDRLTEAVFEQDGTVDKFIGDGMMAFFGAPLELENHATRACAAALAMEQALKELNDAKDLGSTESERPVAIGVGINTGEMVAGNIGSSRRFEYTVVGDAVNLAARLEPLNRLLGTNILLSEATYRDVTVGNGPPANWSFRELGAFRVKGRERPVTLYELMDPLTYVKADALCDQFEAALARYHEHAFADARAAFEECRTMHPGDGPSTFYIERCQRLEEVSTRPSAVIDLRSTGS
jgi:adenylate cyclase